MTIDFAVENPTADSPTTTVPLLIVNPNFEKFIAPLSDAEETELEESILKNGIIDPIIVWGTTILDGHHRYKVCQKHSLPFRTHSVNVIDETAALIWMIEHQLGRRNISDFYRCELVLAKEQLLKAQGRERMAEGGRESARLRAEQACKNDHVEDARQADSGSRNRLVALETPGKAGVSCAATGILVERACRAVEVKTR